MTTISKPELDALLTAENVADLFMVSPMTIRSWAKNGVIPAMKIGRLWRFRRSDIETWMATRPVENGDPSSPDASQTHLV